MNGSLWENHIQLNELKHVWMKMIDRKINNWNQRLVLVANFLCNLRKSSTEWKSSEFRTETNKWNYLICISIWCSFVNEIYSSAKIISIDLIFISYKNEQNFFSFIKQRDH
jgi:hypothetical protein